MSKIVIIGTAYPLRGGGLATFNERLARQFLAEGHEVLIYTFTLQYPEFLFPGKSQYSEGEPPDDLNIIEAINSVNPINWICSGLKIKREYADIVLIRYWIPFMAPCLGTIARIVSSNKHSKIIGIIDNVIPHEKRPGDRIFTKYFVKSVGGFLTMSELVKNNLRDFTQKEIDLVHHPLYDNFGEKIPKRVAREKLNIPNDVYVFLFFGFIRKYKGLDLLISAFELLENNENLRLLICGEFYACEEEINDQINRSKKNSQILKHTHFIKDEDVGIYFSAADCVVQPYRSATQSGVTPLTYHFEIPMIVTNVGALPDLVPPDLGKVCIPEPEDIARAMQEMLTFDLDQFEISIKDEKKKLSWEKFTSAIIQLGEKLKLNK